MVVLRAVGTGMCVFHQCEMVATSCGGVLLRWFRVGAKRPASDFVFDAKSRIVDGVGLSFTSLVLGYDCGSSVDVASQRSVHVCVRVITFCREAPPSAKRAKRASALIEVTVGYQLL